MRWPSPIVTTAFFQSGRCPMRRPSRRDLPGTWITFTASTSTLNESATASAMSRFVALFATANVYRRLLVWLIERSVITGRMRIVFPLMLIRRAPRSRPSRVPPLRRSRRALSRAARALLAPRLRASARDARTILRRARALPCIGQRRDERLKQHPAPFRRRDDRRRKLHRAVGAAIRLDDRGVAGRRRGQRSGLDFRARGLAGFFLALAALLARRLRTDDAGDRPRDRAFRGRLRGRGLRFRRGRFDRCLRSRHGRRLRGGGLRGGGLRRSGFLRRRRGLLVLLFVRHQAFLTMTTPFFPPGTAPSMTRSERAGSLFRITRFRTVTLSAPWRAAIRSPLRTRPGVVPEPTEP